MADQADVRRIALEYPGVVEDKGRFAFSIATGGKLKGLAWVWMERFEPKQARVPNPTVLAVRVADQTEKAALLAADPERFFTEPHYNGYPAVLVRLPLLSDAELRRVIEEAWRCQAPKSLLAGGAAKPAAAAVRLAKKPAKAANKKPTAKPAKKPAAKRKRLPR